MRLSTEAPFREPKAEKVHLIMYKLAGELTADIFEDKHQMLEYAKENFTAIPFTVNALTWEHLKELIDQKFFDDSPMFHSQSNASSFFGFKDKELQVSITEDQAKLLLNLIESYNIKSLFKALELENKLRKLMK